MPQPEFFYPRVHAVYRNFEQTRGFFLTPVGLFKRGQHIRPFDFLKVNAFGGQSRRDRSGRGPQLRKSSGAISAARAQSTSRSQTLRNSRTLPGQSYEQSDAAAASFR